MQRFQPWLRRWDLRPDGPALSTPRADLLPVSWRRRPAMLKVSHEAEEKAGARVLAWWRGGGAAEVLALDGPALLMARADRGDGLMWRCLDDDDGATRVLCTVAARLHAPLAAPRALPPLIPAERLFQPLLSRDGRGLFPRAARRAEALLADPDGPPVVLHGDLHHGNVLRFGPGDWRAIDAKGVLGERALDYVPMLLNPDLIDPTLEIATAPGRLAARIARVAGETGLAPERLRGWAEAWAALAALQFEADGDGARARVATRIGAAAAEAAG